MKEHEHAAKHIPETHPAHDEVAKERRRPTTPIGSKVVRKDKPKSGNRTVRRTRNNVTTGLKRQQPQQPNRRPDHERNASRNQRPHLRNDSGQSNRAPGPTRWRDVSLLQRLLPANVFVRARQCQAGG